VRAGNATIRLKSIKVCRLLVPDKEGGQV